jgi:hypothetical protein
MTKSKKRPTIAKPNIQYEIVCDETNSVQEESTTTDTKKRGRKTKASVKNYTKPLDSANQVTNIIMHLKCSMNDLHAYNESLTRQMTDPLVYNPDVPPEIKTYEKHDHEYSVYEEANANQHNEFAYQTNTTDPTFSASRYSNDTNVSDTQKVAESAQEVEMKDINAKLKRLKLNLYKNNLGEKKSACFWCTYDFDNEECYIPKYAMDDAVHGYGSFCRPECAAAYLMKEDLDDSTKFERYHLLNQVYGKIYDYKKSIKPAPNPYYLLDKFYGTLSIQEYRKLLKSEHLLMVLEKPLTRILPELHEDNDETQNDQNRKQIGMYKVKRQTDKGHAPTKAAILKEHFGL